LRGIAAAKEPRFCKKSACLSTNTECAGASSQSVAGKTAKALGLTIPDKLLATVQLLHELVPRVRPR
jgi:hypothetical protein